MNGRAQASTEFLIILGVALSVLLIIMSVVSTTQKVNTSVFELNKARAVVDDIANAAELVYRQGLGSKTKIIVTMPNSVNHYNFSGNLIQLNIALEENRDVYRSVDFQIASPSITPGSGNRLLYLESGKDFVYITDNATQVAQKCGNNKREGNEQCDGSDLAGETCTSVGYDSGTLDCQAACVRDISSCTGFGTAPNSITNLIKHSHGADWIYWTWTNPTNPDFSKNIVYIDGVNLVNTSSARYRAIGFTPVTSHTLKVHTMDSGGNINTTDVTSTATTGLNNYLSAVTVQFCNAEDNANKGTLNSACTGNYPSVCTPGNDLLGCNDAYVELHTANKVSGQSKYAGLNTSSHNSTITDCTNVSSVSVCYEWWADGGTADCAISVDANGGKSYTIATTTCPGQTANPGVTCTNVTSLETWTCNNFFNASGTPAAIKSEAQQNAGAATVNITWDVLYYNISYKIS